MPFMLMFSKCMWPKECAELLTLIILLGLHEPSFNIRQVCFERGLIWGRNTVAGDGVWLSQDRESLPVAREQRHQ